MVRPEGDLSRIYASNSLSGHPLITKIISRVCQETVGGWNGWWGVRGSPPQLSPSHIKVVPTLELSLERIKSFRVEIAQQIQRVLGIFGTEMIVIGD